MKAALAALTLCILASTPALAEWRVVDGVAVVHTTETNANVDSLVLSCGDPVNLELYTTGGPVRPHGFTGEADYFYEADRVVAQIDGNVVPLVALGAGHAVILDAQDEDGDIGRLQLDFIDMLQRGEILTLGFDVTPQNDPVTGSRYETYARFSLTGSSAVLSVVFSACR